MRYFVNRPFMWYQKNYTTGDMIIPSDINMTDTQLKIRLKAKILIEENKLNSVQKGMIKQPIQNNAGIKSVNTESINMEEEPAVIKETKNNNYGFKKYKNR